MEKYLQGSHDYVSPFFQSPSAVALAEKESDTCINEKGPEACRLFGRAQFTDGRLACKECGTPFAKKVPTDAFTLGPAKLPSQSTKAFGKAVCELRHAKGLSQKEFAEETKVTRPYITKIEGGRHLPSMDFHAKMANALGMTFSNFIQKTWGEILDPS